MRIPCACFSLTGRPPQPCRIAHLRTERCSPMTCQTHELTRLPSPSSDLILRKLGRLNASVCPAGTLERVAGEGFEFTAWIDPVPFPLEATLIDALIAVRGGACPGASEAERSETPRVRYPRAYFRAALSNAAKRVRETPEGSRHRVL